jgi:hypothetical protein
MGRNSEGLRQSPHQSRRVRADLQFLPTGLRLQYNSKFRVLDLRTTEDRNSFSLAALLERTIPSCLEHDPIQSQVSRAFAFRILPCCGDVKHGCTRVHRLIAAKVHSLFPGWPPDLHRTIRQQLCPRIRDSPAFTNWSVFDSNTET